MNKKIFVLFTKYKLLIAYLAALVLLISAVKVEAAGPPYNHHSAFYQDLIGEFSDWCFFTESVCWSPSVEKNKCDKGNKMNWKLPRHGCVNKILERFEQEYPDLVKVRQIGESEDGKIINAIRIATSLYFDPIKINPKPVILINGSVHGEEQGTTRILLDWLDYITNPDNRGKKAYPGTTYTIDYILKNRVIWIVPVLNPDGYDNCSHMNSNTINIYRDFSFQWRDYKWRLPKNTYTGPHPFSQSETRTLDGFAETIGPNMYLDVHGYVTSIVGLYDTNNDNLMEGVSFCGDGKPKAMTLCNWHISQPYNSFSWSPPCYAATSTTYTINNDILQYVYRNDSDPNSHESLPYLAEQDQYSGNCLGETHKLMKRYYAPYDEFSYPICYEEEPEDRGNGRKGYGQIYVHMWARYGAVSFLYEIQKYNYSAADNSFNKNGINECNPDKQEPQRLFYPTRSEEWIQRIVEDSYYPLNRIALAADNAIPGAHPVSTFPDSSMGGTRHNLAVTSLRAFHHGSDLNLMDTYWPVDGKRGGPKDKRSGFYGYGKIDCTVTNYGNECCGNFDIDIRIEDITLDKKFEHTCSCGVLDGGKSTTCSFLKIEFKRGYEYRVTCIVTPRDYVEVDNPVIDINGDQSCAALYNHLGWVPQECYKSGGNWWSKWNTNNSRSISFRAVLNPKPILDTNGNTPLNINGYPIGHIAAVTSL